MRRVGSLVKRHSTFYVTGGTTAIWFGIRSDTVDIDVAGDVDEIFSEIGKLKNELQLNIETAKPTDFVPSLPGETGRHIEIGMFGKADFYHFDPFAQAFAKILRGHATDISDTKALIARKLVDPIQLQEMIKALPDSAFERYIRLRRPFVEQAVDEFVRHVSM